MSIKCDQVIFMPAHIEGRRGYQVVGKSAGVRSDEVEFIETYGIPLAVNPERFSEGRRLLRLPSKRLGFNYLKNIGVGYDGRFGAIYSLTLIVDEEQFLALGADPIVFEGAYEVNIHRRGELEAIDIRRVAKKEIDFQAIRDQVQNRTTLLRIIRALIEGRKRIILVSSSDQGNGNLLRNLLLLLPTEIRVVPYTTYAVELDKETPFRLLTVPAADYRYLPMANNWEVINLDRTDYATPNGTTSSQIADYLCTIVYEGRLGELKQFHARFDSYPPHLEVLARLEYAYYESLVSKTKAPEERIQLSLKLAENGLTAEMSQKYYNLAVGLAAQLNDVGKLTECFLSRLRFVKNFTAFESFVDVFDDGLKLLLPMNPEKAVEFVKSALEIASEQDKESLVTLIVELLFEKNLAYMRPLLILMRETLFQRVFLQEIRRNKEYRIIPRIMSELISLGYTYEASGLICAVLSDIDLGEDIVKHTNVFRELLESPASEQLPIGVRTVIINALLDLLRSVIKRSTVRWRSISFLNALVVMLAPLGIIGLWSVGYPQLQFTSWITSLVGEGLTFYVALFVFAFVFLILNVFLILSLIYNGILLVYGGLRGFPRWSEDIKDPVTFTRLLTQNLVHPISSYLQKSHAQCKSRSERSQIRKLSGKLTKLHKHLLNMPVP